MKHIKLNINSKSFRTLERNYFNVLTDYIKTEFLPRSLAKPRPQSWRPGVHADKVDVVERRAITTPGRIDVSPVKKSLLGLQLDDVPAAVTPHREGLTFIHVLYLCKTNKVHHRKVVAMGLVRNDVSWTNYELLGGFVGTFTDPLHTKDNDYKVL